MGFKTYTCGIAKSCGGCEWLAVPYPIQLRRKREAVEQLFADLLPEARTAQAREQRLPIVGMDENAPQLMAELGSAGVLAGAGGTCAVVGAGSGAGVLAGTAANAADGVDATNAAPSGPSAINGSSGPTSSALSPIHYRHKAATPFAPGARGSVRSGFYVRGTHRIVPCASCLVEAPGAREALTAVARAAEELHIPAYDEDRGRGLVRHAVARVGFATNECLLTVVTNGKGIGREREFVKRIQAHAPQVTAIAQNVNQRRTNAILGHESRALAGDGRMTDKLLGCTFEIGPTSFYQTNPAQTERLYALAIAGAGLAPGMRVLDAYCGIGTIGLCAARQVPGLEVVGVEQVEGAVADARINAQLNGLSDCCRFVCADATAYMRDVRRGRQGFDAVLMDPPRAGSTPAFLRGVAELAPERVVYVSCNPETQRRDVDQLLASGYGLESLVAVDMFPHTKHAETVAVLRRR